jgi:uncharacterized protein YhbP (UPF0306 family)
VALIRGVQFKGEIRLLEGEEADENARCTSAVSVARMLPRRCGRFASTS